ncbi:MAG: HD domain-containing protein [Thermomicrobiales bacterium]|nr:HD domain-containing protein [Thermomicrobiales bacterium]
MSALRDRLDFFVATDALKAEQRSTWIRNEPRFETVAEHVWHTTLLAMLFADAAPDGIDHNKVRDLLTMHDLVEVFAGDVPIWDAQDGVEAREWAAGLKLTAMLPADQRSRIDALWQEFQRQETTEARFARAIDALHPMIMSWFPPAIGHDRVADITPTRLVERKQPLIEEFPALWSLAEWLVLAAVEQGFLNEDETSRQLAAKGGSDGI